MSTRTFPVSCRCGAIAGDADVAASNGVHVVCCCDDCQAYARYVGALGADNGGGVVDEFGGTAIWQMAPAQLRITRGKEHVRCVQLSEKGMLRFYAGCCGVPIGNQMQNPGVPFVGVVHTFLLPRGPSRDAVLGPPVRSQTRFATGGEKGDKPLDIARVVFRALRLILGGYLRGGARPSPFRDEAGVLITTPRVLTPAERDALRPA